MRIKPIVVLSVIAGFVFCGYVAQAVSDDVPSFRDDQNSTGGSAPSKARFPRNAAELDLMFDAINNWGRWGTNDQLGAANLITSEKRKQAIAVARIGRIVSLAHPVLTEAAGGNGSPFVHTMEHGLTTDTYQVSYHGWLHSHLDALCHLPYKDKHYNGYPSTAVNTEHGCTKLGIENLQNGVITRGILIDIPRLRNVPWLEPGTAVFVEDLEAWERKAGVTVSSGDAIFLRTGRWARWAKLRRVAYEIA